MILADASAALSSAQPFDIQNDPWISIELNGRNDGVFLYSIEPIRWNGKSELAGMGGRISGYRAMKRRLSISYGITFPPLPIGAKIPLGGHCYRVTELADPNPIKKGPEGGQYVKFELIEVTEFGKFAPNPNSGTIPTMGSNGGSFEFIGCTKIRVVREFKIAQITEDKPGEFTAHLTINGIREETGIQMEATVRSGDILMLKEHGFEILKIVPRDEKKGFIGWVELDLEPLSEARVKKAKSIVRPKLIRSDKGK